MEKESEKQVALVPFVLRSIHLACDAVERAWASAMDSVGSQPVWNHVV